MHSVHFLFAMCTVERQCMRPMQLAGLMPAVCGAEHSMVQIATDRRDGREYAVKFFLCGPLFLAHASLFIAHAQVQPSNITLACWDHREMAMSDESGRKKGLGGDLVATSASVRFLPQVHAICDGAYATSGGGSQTLPPFIVMDRGTPLSALPFGQKLDILVVLICLP